MRSSKSIEIEIQQLETQLAPIHSQLDSKIREFTAALPPAVGEWMQTETKRKIEENAEKVTAAGVESLRQLKSELANLISKLPEHCTKAIGSEAHWPHRCAPAGRRDYSAHNKESYFSTVFRTSIGHLGALLHKHGLLNRQAGSLEIWEESGNNFRYCINPGFDERKYPAVVEYNGRMDKHKSLTEELELKRAEFAKAKATELWNDA